MSSDTEEETSLRDVNRKGEGEKVFLVRETVSSMHKCLPGRYFMPSVKFMHPGSCKRIKVSRYSTIAHVEIEIKICQGCGR